MGHVRHALLDLRLPIGGWLAWLALAFAVVAWGSIAVWSAGEPDTLWLPAFLAVFPAVAAVPALSVRRRRFRAAALVCGLLLAGGGVFALLLGGLAFVPAGLVLLAAAAFGGGRPTPDRRARPG